MEGACPGHLLPLYTPVGVLQTDPPGHSPRCSPPCKGNRDFGEHYASVNQELWYNIGGICGQLFLINCTANCADHPAGWAATVVMAIDLCQNCSGITMRLSKLSFQLIGNVEAGSIPITYRNVSSHVI